MKRFEKFLNVLCILLCIIGFAASLVTKSYIECTLWFIVLLQDLTELRLRKVIKIQGDLIKIKDLRLKEYEGEEKC